jgi:hypothetical protein
MYPEGVPCEQYKAIEEEKRALAAQPLPSPQLPVEELNRHKAAEEWVKTLSISINLLGIEVNVNDFGIIGSLSLVTIGLWLLFSVRRENRAIITLLRDAYWDTKFLKAKKYRTNKWDIANMAFQGAVHSQIFIGAGRDDEPWSTEKIFATDFSRQKKRIKREETKSGFGGFWNSIATSTRWDRFTGFWTHRVRFLVIGLMFLPSATIIFIIYADIHSLQLCSPFRANYPKVVSIFNGDLNFIFGRNVLTGAASAFFSIIINIAILVFQGRTKEGLDDFSHSLGLEGSPTETSSE